VAARAGLRHVRDVRPNMVADFEGPPFSVQRSRVEETMSEHATIVFQDKGDGTDNDESDIEGQLLVGELKTLANIHRVYCVTMAVDKLRFLNYNMMLEVLSNLAVNKLAYLVSNSCNRCVRRTIVFLT